MHHHGFQRSFAARRLGLVLLAAAATGCSGVRNWWDNGLKVGPNYARPAAPVEAAYRDAAAPEVIVEPADHAAWWRVFNDPQLEALILAAYQQNRDLRTAGLRVLEARAQYGIAAANLWPQRQQAFAQYRRNQISRESAFATPFIPRHYDDWFSGFDLSWELDVWGRIRRSIASAEAGYEASIEDYDAVLVTLIGDVASTYIEIRAFDERLALARRNVEIQRGSLRLAQARFEGEVVSELDVQQARSNLAETSSLIPVLEQGRRLAENRLAVLLGLPPAEAAIWTANRGPIPTPPAEVVVGVPAELLRRRPDVRAAERRVAEQSEQIGVAVADLLPQFGLNGSIALQANDFSDLFKSTAVAAFISPGLRWNILNYGRITNNVRVQEARFLQHVTAYEQVVLNAQREVEDAIVSYLRSREGVVQRQITADAASRSVEIARTQYVEGAIDFNRVFVLESDLVAKQDNLVQTRAEIAIALIQTYKALGGGWQLRLAAPYTATAAPLRFEDQPGLPRSLEELPEAPRL